MRCVKVPYRWQTQAGGAKRDADGQSKSGVERASAPPPSKRSPAKRVRCEKEEGGSGYAAFTALTETAKAEWSELLLTMKGRGQSGIGMEPHRHNRQSPVTLKTGG